jgi:hypothetical protein
MTRNEAVRQMVKEETARNYAAFDPNKTCGSGFLVSSADLTNNAVLVEVMSIAAQQVRANVPIEYRGQIRTNVRDAGSPHPEGTSILYWQYIPKES